MDRSHHALCGDDSFGPAVLSPDCRGGFDFTVTFEEAILTILPTAIFLIFAPLRILGLLRSHLNIQRNALYAAKLAAVGVYTSFQLALVVVVASQPRLQTHSSIASAVLLLLTGLALAALSHLEHAKSIRPSYLIEGYLLLTAFFDIARVRTEWLLETNDAVAGIMTGSLVAKCIMLALEAMEKRSMLPGQSFSREGSGGLLSRMSFWWLNPFMLTGFRKVLAVDDLPEIHEKLDSERLANMIQGTWQNCNQKRKHALTFACLWSLRWEVVGAYIPKFVFVALRICQALLIKAATNFVDDKETPMSYGYGLIGGFAFLYLSLAIAMGWASHLTFRTMSMIRGQLISLIYNKLTTLPITNIDESSAMTLMSTDVQRITESFYYLVIDALPNTCQLGIAVYILYTNLGAVCVAPIIVTVVATALSTVTAGRVTMKQKLWFESIEKRINFTSEILGAMRNVKMLGLAHQMEKTIEQLRENEIQTSRLFRRFQAVNNAIVNLPSVFIMFFLFAAYAIVAMLSGTGSFDVSKAISSMAALNLLIEPLTQLLYAIPPGWGSLGCFTRIQEFLLEDSRVEARSFRSSTDSKATSSQEKEKGEKGGLQMQSKELTINRPYIQLEHANIGWSDAAPSVAKDVTTSIQPECKLTVIVGPVGSGKTTLLRGILGEATRVQGSVRVSTTEMAYCDQSPWIINGTIRQNVLGDSGLDQTWYDTVIQACALDVDLRQLPKGDQTIVGSKGLKLSGGQKQRLSLARAVYARKQWAILDDILSGLDSLTEEHVFKRVIGPEGLFRQIGTSVILATHSTRRLPQADLIMALNETGEIVEQGTFDKLNVPGTYVHSLKVKLEEEKGQNEQGKDNADIIDKADTADKVEPEVATEEDADESRKSGGLGTYKYYLEALGPGAVLVFVVILAVNAFLNGFQYVWVNWWAESTERGENKGLGHWLGVFAAINFLDCISLVFGIGFLWMYIIPRSGNSLHHGMVHRAIRAPLSYFSKVETGVLVNRFSQDLRLADMVLPGSAVNIAYHGGSCLVVIALAITAIPYVAIALPFIGVVLFFVQRFYLRTSRQLRLLEIEQNAPLFSHFIESSSGLATIRSFGWTAEYEGKNRKYLNDSQKPFYLLLCCQRWLIFVLDLIVAGFAILIVGVAVGLRDRMSAGFFGLALVNLMYMTHSLTNLVQHWTSFETSIGAVKRIKSFAEDTPCEGSPSETDTPDPSWPSQGTLSFEDLSASYTDENSAVLRNVSFTAESGQRVGIVGRTGSGKTSALLAILRMIEVTSGKIVLDGVDLSAVAGSVVRERIICLTQDSFIFTASIRKNLDPTGVCQDEALQDALQKVGLWSILEGKAAKDTAEGIGPVLDTVMDKDFLSHGQRQLFCLARALLKQGKLLVLDEPTSSVDSETDSKMQKIIREHFSHHTIIMIAHRMSSLLDFDRVAVLEGGRLVEFGAPSELLQDTSSHFARLNKNAS